MSNPRYTGTSNYSRDNVGKDGKQILFPWSAGRTISTRQAAERMGMCEDTVRDMCEAGEIQSYPHRPGKKGSPIRIVAESVELWLERKLAKYDIGDKELYKRLNMPSPQIAQNTPGKTASKTRI